MSERRAESPVDPGGATPIRDGRRTNARVRSPRVTVAREHRSGCPALLAWDIPDACQCDYPLVARDDTGRRVKRP